MTPETEQLLEQVTSAARGTDVTGAVQSHPAWHDLPVEAREVAYAETVRLRQMEAALDPEGLSTTARAVLARLR
jgi:hypothetical protein